MAWLLLISLTPVSTEKEQAEQKKNKLHSLERKGTAGNGRLQPGLLAKRLQLLRRLAALRRGLLCTGTKGRLHQGKTPI